MIITVLRDLIRCRGAVAAVEFTLVFPFMIILILGGVVASNAYQREHDVIHAATTVVDLMARFSKMSSADRDRMFGAAEVLASDGEQTIKVRIANIQNIGGQHKISWSRAKNWTELRDSDLASIHIPELEEYETILYAEVQTHYVPVFILDYFPEIDISYAALRQPLFVDNVELHD